MILNWLRRPYYFEENKHKRLRLNVLIALFVFLFLYVFRPFRIDEYVDNIVLLCLGYGLVTLLICAFWMLLLPHLFSSWFDNKRWTSAKEIIYLSSMIIVIGIVNLLYSAWMSVFSMSWADFWVTQLYTLSLAVFPIIAIVIFEERRQSNRHSTLSENMSAALNQQHTGMAISHHLTLTASNEEYIQLDSASVFYLKSDANYIEVIHREGDQFKKHLLRNTLKAMETQLASEQQFFRCHRSYLVNLNKVIHISGNAQGLKLHLEGMEGVVPVSRKHNDFLKNRFTIRP